MEQTIDELKDIWERKGMVPICGWDWVLGHKDDEYGDLKIEVEFDGEKVAEALACERRGTLKKMLRDYKRKSKNTE